MNIGINPSQIIMVIISGLSISLMVAFVGMILWYIKAKPKLDSIEGNLEKKAAADEVIKIAQELERKKEEAIRIKSEIESKRTIDECELIRKGCQPLIMEQLRGIWASIDLLGKGQDKLADKLEKWMVGNGK